MAEFSYVAMASTGQRNQGRLTANSEREVMAMLDARGLFPVSVTAVHDAAGGHGWQKKIKPRAMAMFYAQLSDLLRSGVPLLRSMDILERQSSTPALSQVIREVKAKVADGTTLADAMMAYPKAFTELAISMVRAGQEGGFLEDVLKRIADFTEQQEDLKGKVVGAMAYPIFLSVIGFIVLNVLVIVFVPKFEDIFKRLEEKGELPTITQILMGTSHFMQRHGWWAALVVIGLVMVLRRWAATPSGRLRIDRIRLKFPGAGAVYLQLALSRFTRILGTLLHNGIPILQALRIAKDSTGNRVLSEAIEKSAENIKSGDKLATPLAASKYFPRDVVEMISVGEESNSLETVLVDISIGLEKRTTRQLDLFVRLLEPIMLLVMAAVTLFVVAGLLLPVFKMSSAVG
jgi:general secretion pathway protein F/type IV pilus assembly protein PilC